MIRILTYLVNLSNPLAVVTYLISLKLPCKIKKHLYEEITL